MRKLSELLPIARQYLLTVEHPKMDVLHDEYACFAAKKAWQDGEMTHKEQWQIRTAIENELLNTHGCSTIASAVREHFEDGHCELDDPKYIGHRDKWLDEFQAKLEAEGW